MAQKMDLENIGALKISVVADYTADTSVILFTGHHSFFDGVQFFSLLQYFTTKKDFSQLPHVTAPEQKFML